MLMAYLELASTAPGLVNGGAAEVVAAFVAAGVGVGVGTGSDVGGGVGGAAAAPGIWRCKRAYSTALPRFDTTSPCCGELELAAAICAHADGR